MKGRKSSKFLSSSWQLLQPHSYVVAVASPSLKSVNPPAEFLITFEVVNQLICSLVSLRRDNVAQMTSLFSPSAAAVSIAVRSTTVNGSAQWASSFAAWACDGDKKCSFLNQRWINDVQSRHTWSEKTTHWLAFAKCVYTELRRESKKINSARHVSQHTKGSSVTQLQVAESWVSERSKETRRRVMIVFLYPM